jgi:hypothetical protein
MLWCMRRTNIYLSEREQAALDARAREEGSTRSDLLRRIVDEELGLDEADPDVDRELLAAAARIAKRAREHGRGDPDLSSG